MNKKKNTITGIGYNPDDKLIVQKSRPLLALAQSDLSLAEFKILDAYLARINSHNPEERTVVFSKGQLEYLLGVTRINKNDLDKRLRNLYKPIDLAKGDLQRLHLVALFDEAFAEQDENGVWEITLTCTPSAMKYIFNAEQFGYIKYKLRNIVSLKSRYSLTLFLYLEANRIRKTWDVSLDELKEVLNCINDASYDEFKIFNQRILKSCQKELCEKSNCRFSYEPIRKGRKVVAIRFELETLSSLAKDAAAPVPELSATEEHDYENDTFAFLSEACNKEFSSEEMAVVFALINNMQLPPHSMGIEFSRYHYLAEKYALLNLEAKKTDIKNRFSYFKKMILNDRGEK